MRRLRQRGEADALTLIRNIVLSLVLALFLFWYVLTFFDPRAEGSVDWALALLAVLGVVLHLTIRPVAIQRMVAANDEESLLSTYRTGMFLGVGASELVALAGWVGIALTGREWLYPIGLSFALVGFWRVAPSQRVFAHCDELLLAQGKTIRMTEAWRRAVTGPPEAAG